MLFVAAVFATPTFLIANTLLVAATLITCVVAAFSLRSIVEQKPRIDSENRQDLTSVSASQILTESLPLTLSAIISFIIVQGDLVLSGWIPDAGESFSYVGAKKCVQLITIPLLVVNTMATPTSGPAAIAPSPARARPFFQPNHPHSLRFSSVTFTMGCGYAIHGL